MLQVSCSHFGGGQSICHSLTTRLIIASSSNCNRTTTKQNTYIQHVHLEGSIACSGATEDPLSQAPFHCMHAQTHTQRDNVSFIIPCVIIPAQQQWKPK